MTENRKLNAEELNAVNGGKKVDRKDLQKYNQTYQIIYCRVTPAIIAKAEVKIFKIDDNGDLIVLANSSTDRVTLLKYNKEFKIIGYNDDGTSLQATIQYDDTSKVWFEA